MDLRERLFWYFTCVTFTLVAARERQLSTPSLSLLEEDAAPMDVLKGLYIKDSESGELRTFGNFNTAVNQLITNQQNFLEQLRPIGTTGLAGTGLAGTGLAGTGLAGAGFAGTGLAGAGFAGAGLAGTGSNVSPILVNLGGNNAGNNQPPVAQLIPQIVGQVVANGRRHRRPNTNRRRPNVNRRRRPNNNRRRRRPSVTVVRP